MLASQRRRFVLYVLADAAERVTTLAELIDEVVTLETAIEFEPLTNDRLTEIATDLYHWQLPVLHDVGIIDCDSRHKTIRYLAPPTLEPWVRRARSEELAQDPRQPSSL